MILKAHLKGVLQTGGSETSSGDEQRDYHVSSVRAIIRIKRNNVTQAQLEPQKFKETKTSKELPFEPFFYRFFLPFTRVRKLKGLLISLQTFLNV
jgi:hypothetical protein